MAFTSTTIRGFKLGPVDRTPLYDDLTSALAAGVSSLSSLGGGDALSRAIVAFWDVYRQTPATAGTISATALLSVGASSTSALVTLQFQLVPAV